LYIYTTTFIIVVSITFLPAILKIRIYYTDLVHGKLNTSALKLKYMSSLKILTDYTSKIFDLLFSPDSNLVSEEYTDIMANKNDKEKYFEAIKKAKISQSEEKVQLSSGKTLIVSP